MNKIDPICGMKGHIESYGKYFCSEFCLRKYEKQLNLGEKILEEKSTKWYKEKIVIVSAAIITIVLTDTLLSHFGIKVLNNLVTSFYYYLKMIWIAILVGLVIAGLIDHYIPREYISKFLSKRDKKTIFYAVGLGFLMSACSHGILAISIALYKKGASIPAVIAFLLAAPWANMPVTIMLFGFFGIKAFLLIFSSISIAIFTGVIYQFFDKKGWIERNKNFIENEEDFSIIKDIQKRWKNYHLSLSSIAEDFYGTLRGILEISKMVLWWILVGIFFAAAVKSYVPHGFMMNYLGPSIGGLSLTLILATIIEICSEGSSPLAFELFRQTGSFGNAFVFLMAGVATDYTEIGLIWTNIGKKSAWLLPIITVPQIIILGYLFNILI